MNPDLGQRYTCGRRYTCHNEMEHQRRAARSIHKQAAVVEARLKAEPGRADAPAICRCAWEVVRLHGCQCPGYVNYRTRERGF